MVSLLLHEPIANSQQDLRVGNKYRIGRKIGSGSFGDIYLGTQCLSLSIHKRVLTYSSRH
jgi:hypothetical protein